MLLKRDDPMMKSTALAVIIGLLSTAAQAQSDMADQWILLSIDGAPFAGNATLDLSEDGRVSGQGPCNSFFGANQSSLPMLNLGPLASTKMACPDLALEDAYLAALAAMTSASLGKDDVLVLLGPDARSMSFSRASQ